MRTRHGITRLPVAAEEGLLTKSRNAGPSAQELAGELGAHLAAAKLSVEKALRIVYQPQAVFRVRPVARCTASIPGEPRAALNSCADLALSTSMLSCPAALRATGHSESVLSVHFSPDGSGLVSGSGDTTVRFWDLNTQLPKHECKVSDTSGAAPPLQHQTGYLDMASKPITYAVCVGPQKLGAGSGMVAGWTVSVAPRARRIVVS